jgi:hypothetical protein
MTMRILKLLPLVLLPVFAHAQWRENGKPVPDNEWRKSIGDFGAQLEFTAKPDELFAAWEKPGDYVQVPGFTDSVHRNETIVGVVFFTGCKPDADGNCNATVDYLILRPDGTVYADLKGGELWKNKRAPSGHEVQLAAQPLGIRIESADPFGSYTVTATIRDINAGLNLKLVRTIRVETSEKKGDAP